MQTQTISYEIQKDKGWVLANNSASKFIVHSEKRSNTSENYLTSPVYTLTIHYYNNNNELMNQQFWANGQDAIHQHFIHLPRRSDLTINGVANNALKTEDLIDYVYTDTHPENGKIIGITNPIGLNGAIKFILPNANYTLTIELFHGFIGKRDPRTQALSHFHTPSALMVQRGTWDVIVNIPIEVKEE